MSKTVLKSLLCTLILSGLSLKRVRADIAPDPFPIVHEPSFLPVVLIVAVVVVAAVLLRKFRKK